MKTPYAIIIMDGYGINKDTNGNAVYADGSKNVTALEKEYPSSQLGASGMSVGLPTDRWATPRSDTSTSERAASCIRI